MSCCCMSHGLHHLVKRSFLLLKVVCKASSHSFDSAMAEQAASIKNFKKYLFEMWHNLDS